MNTKLQIIYLEDNPDDVGLAERELLKSGLVFNMLMVESKKEFVKALTEFTPDLILSDHSLPGFNSLEAYKIVCEKKPGTPFILLTGSVSEEFAVECLLAGIDDYILKSNLIRLPSSIDRILSKRKIKEEKDVIENLLRELQNTYRQIESKNKEITDSINYAKRIQDTILPNDTQFYREFHDGFAIYAPRDIVSGDLYSLTKNTTIGNNNVSLKLLSAIDCTGHGIPGAFMSLLVSVLMNETLKHNDIQSPADVLFHLNKKLPSMLNRNNRERITDGFDIALCALDLESRMAYFSGANRPLWIVRKNGTGYDLLDYKGTKASIGSHTPPEQVFENNTIQLEINDRLFLFTDGMTDQFGGIHGKKLGRKKFKELLLNSAHLDMQLQKKHILNFFTEWRDQLEQVDDMLILGVEIN